MRQISVFLLFSFLLSGMATLGQNIDTVSKNDDTMPDSLFLIMERLSSPAGNNVTREVLKENKFINADTRPQFFMNDIRAWKNQKDIFFYVLCGLLLFLGLFKTFYGHYFSTLFTVYFNTSLRQTQLSEQLLQAKFPSFLLNVFFVLVAGIFSWLLFLNYNDVPERSLYLMLQICLVAVAIIYLVKFIFLKFLGWISGISDVTNHYIFIIFLVNKLLSIVLIPFVVLIAMGKKEWISIYITLALLSVGVLLLSRYIKSYGLLRQKFPVTPFHFLIFFVGAELLPLMIMYKVTIDYLI